MLPSSVIGSVTETVGLFDCDHRRLARWVTDQLGPGVIQRTCEYDSLDQLTSALASRSAVRHRALIPWGTWTVMLTDGPHGTDVGLLPSWAARSLGCVAVRATAAPAGRGQFEAVIFELFDPAASDDPLRCRRSITAANDGGRWVFRQTGEPLAFETTDRYSTRLIRHRFTVTMLHDYLVALGLDPHTSLDLGNTLVVESPAPDSHDAPAGGGHR